MPLADPAAASYVYSSQAVLAAQAVEEAGRSRAWEALERAAETFREAGVSGVERSEPLIGDPKAVILDEATQWSADLVVAGRFFAKYQPSATVYLSAQWTEENLKRN